MDLGALAWTLAREGFYASAADAEAAPFAEALQHNARLALRHQQEREAHEEARARAEVERLLTRSR